MAPFEIDCWPNAVVYGPGAAGKVGAAAARLDCSRAVILCGKTIAASAAYATVMESLGDRFVGAFAEVAMHAPLPVVERAAAFIRDARADLVVSLGGGSAIDAGKGARLVACVGADYLSYSLSAGSGARPRPMPKLNVAHIAIPTTGGSGSEVTPTCGLRDAATGHKRIFRDARLIPDLAILDPQAAVGASDALSACSGMTALARCVEALYSARRNPFRSALALHGLGMLARSLPRSVAAPDDLDARADCLIASAMSAIAANVNTSAVHAVGHVIGGRFGLQHGVPHAILLPSGMRLMLPAIGNGQQMALAALGEAPSRLTADEAGARAAERIAELIASLPLPRRLREVGVAREDLDGLADEASRDPILLSSGADLSAAKVRQMLEEAY